MSFDIHYQDGDEYMRLVPYGSLDFDTSIAMFDAISRDGEFICQQRLWDFRQCKLDLDGEAMQEIAKDLQARDRGKGRTALLASSDLNFGLSRLLTVYRETDEHSVRVFRTEEEALAWLLT